MNESYKEKVYDEFIIPAYNIRSDICLQDNDAVIACNFRPDRMIQIASSLTNPQYEFHPYTIKNLC